MEQTPYWMWAKQNPSNNTNTRPHHHHQHHHQLRASGSTSLPMAYTNDDPSWEEQAFAEDATGAFGGGGGCVWPPRSYSCSFCRREFRSAQALGGHMNVHRRDRARLKQSSISPSNNNHQSQLHDHVDQNHHLGFDQYNHHHHHNPPPVCALVYHDHQPNPNLDDGSSWPPRVCDHVQEHHKNIMRSPHVVSPNSPTTWANFVVGRSHNNNITTSEYPKPHHQGGLGKVANLNCVKTDLSVSLSLVLHQTHDPAMLSDHDHDHEEEEEAMRSCKKRKRNDIIHTGDGDDDDDDSSLFPIFLKPKIQTLDHHAEAQEDDLDLELRLGDRPDKVK